MLTMHEKTICRRSRRDARRRGHSSSYPQRAAAGGAVVLFVILSSAAAAADEVADLERTSSANAPPAATDPAREELKQALLTTNAELSRLKAEIALEQTEMLDQIAAESKELASLHDEEAALVRQQRELAGALDEVSQKLLAAETALARAKEAITSTASEVDAQAITLKERLLTSITAAEDPERIATLEGVIKDTEVPLESRLASLLEVFEQTLEDAGSVSSFVMPLALSGIEGRIEEVRVLRVGLLGGYYAHPETAEAGFVLADTQAEGEKANFRGLASGLTGAQRMEINGFIENPARSGFLPIDVTGGSGLSTLQSRQTVVQWFELGGVFMWPLLFVAAASLVMIVERSFTLAARSLGVGRKVESVLALVRGGDLEEAEAECERMRGATGSVLHSALVHRDADRSVMQDAVQEALLHEAPKFQARLPFIALCAAVAPLLGLLGTVTGMILTFKMVTLFGTADPRFMAGGISEALITTQAGLYVAIPSLLMRGILGSIADRALGKLEAGAMAVVLALLRTEEAERVKIGAAS